MQLFVGEELRILFELRVANKATRSAEQELLFEI